MKKSILLTVISIFLVFGLMGCGTKLDPAFEEEVLKEEAEKIAAFLEEEDYEAIIDSMREDLKDKLNPEDLQEPWLAIKESAGEFQKVSEYKIVPQKESLATVILILNYEYNKVQLTITFDTDMNLAGIYMK